MTLTRWALADRDVLIEWSDAHDELCAALVHDTRPVVSDWLVFMLGAEQLSAALARLGHRVAEIVGEHAAHDVSSIRRWAKGDR